MKTVMIFGTFDFLHAGHFHVFSNARALGDRLVVVVARDHRVETLKGVCPIHDEEERVDMLRHVDLIDEAILGHDDDVYALVQEYRPGVIALGYDQQHFVDKLEEKIKEFGLDTQVVRINAYENDRKSSQIKDFMNSHV